MDSTIDSTVDPTTVDSVVVSIADWYGSTIRELGAPRWCSNVGIQCEAPRWCSNAKLQSRMRAFGELWGAACGYVGAMRIALCTALRLYCAPLGNLLWTVLRTPL